MGISIAIRAAGRTLILLGVCAMFGLRAQAPGSPAKPVTAKESAPVLPFSEQGFQRLKTLAEEAEKALAAEEWDNASDRLEEADALLSSWSAETLLKPEILRLRNRLQNVRQQLEEDSEDPPAVEDGLKVDTEVVSLGGADLKAEAERVKTAEKDVEFDVPIDLNDKVLSWVHVFTNERRAYIEATLSRATQYMPMIKQVFVEEGIPQDLAYLGLIESGYKNAARSRARAVGMWQFIRATGRIYGLKGTAWVEERRDPVKATRAAARYLKRLYDREGDWYLALVGYNAGPLTTDRASQGLGTRNYWDMARSRFLRNETKNYVPLFCAAVLVGKNPERYGLKVDQLKPYVYETVEVDKQTSLAVLAKYAKTDAATLKDLNPELLRASTPPGRYTLRVPPGSSTIVARALLKIPPGKRMQFRTYKVRKIDTVAGICARFKISREDLLIANDMRDETLVVGKTLKVPPPASMRIDELDLLSKAEREKILSERPLDSLPRLPGQQPGSRPATHSVLREGHVTASSPRAPETSAKDRPVQPRRESNVHKVHVVKQGETLYSISLRYGVEVKDLRKWNKLKRDMIGIGQKLKVQKP